MLFLRPWQTASRSSQIRPTRAYATAVRKPLRILFCGSDEFSCASLKALHGEHLQNPYSVRSIDVMCRPGKPTGKGLKTIREVPIKAVAQELGLALHERDTFTHWNLPQPAGENINLVVAVSFGLFVPPRILNSAEYGGINVHPSLLPNFRGSAPLQHTILAQEKYTGVTLQTLHPEKFDHGRILAQTPHPGLMIPNVSHCTYQDLLEFITPKAAEILLKGVRERLFEADASEAEGLVPQMSAILHAPKIKSEDRHIDFASQTALDIYRLSRALGRIWTIAGAGDKPQKRSVLFGIEVTSCPQELADMLQSEYTGDRSRFSVLNVLERDGRTFEVPIFKNESQYGDAVLIGTNGDDALLVKEVTVDGEKKMSAVRAFFGEKQRS